MPKLSQKWNVVTNDMKDSRKAHRTIVKGWIADYREMMDIISGAKIKEKEDKLIENDWNLSYKVSELMPLFPARQCNAVGIFEESDIKQYWVMGLYKLISRNRERGIEFHEGGLTSMGVNRTIDMMRRLKVSKWVKKKKCPACIELEMIPLSKQKRKCPECKRLNSEVTRPVTVSFAELKESADMSYKLFDYIDILGAENVLQFSPPAQDTAANKLAEID